MAYMRSLRIRILRSMLPPLMPNRLPLRPLEFLVLAVLEDEPLHGYGMVQRIESRTDGAVRVRPGDLYRVLYRLVRRRLLESIPSEGDDRRSYYGLTVLGRRALREEAEMLRRVVAGVGGAKKASPA
jgi:DNA-binding PadR family transcriptional regulator